MGEYHRSIASYYCTPGTEDDFWEIKVRILTFIEMSGLWFAEEKTFS
jgi:hypothetical protein